MWLFRILDRHTGVWHIRGFQQQGKGRCRRDKNLLPILCLTGQGLQAFRTDAVFARYKAGKYDNSFASFDARRIGNAFFKEFNSERNYELDAINRKRVQDEIENRKFIPPEGYSSLTLYNELKRRAESGDEEAVKILTVWQRKSNRNPYM